MRDVTILVGEKEKQFKAHKIILAIRSSFFKGVFYNEMIETKDSIVKLPTISEEIFPNILNYIYTGKIEPNDIQEILKIASFLGITSLLEVCDEILTRNLDSDNVLDIFNLSLHYNIESLKSKCLYIIDNNFTIISHNINLQVITKSSLLIILQKQLLKKNAEPIDVVRSIFIWGNAGKDSSRKEDIIELMTYVDTDTLTIKDLKKLSEYCPDELKNSLNMFEKRKIQDISTFDIFDQTEKTLKKTKEN